MSVSRHTTLVKSRFRYDRSWDGCVTFFKHKARQTYFDRKTINRACMFPEEPMRNV